MVNIPLLQKELEYLTNNPGALCQQTWLEPSTTSVCGTVGCLAGNAALHAGRVIKTTLPCTGETIYEPVHPSGSFEALGMELLDLTESQAVSLFDGDNTLVDLWEVASNITDGEISPPPSLQGERDGHMPGVF